MSVQKYEFPKSLLKDLPFNHIFFGWSKIRKFVLQSVCGHEYIPVPFIEDFRIYDLGYVIFKKSRSFKNVLFHEAPHALPVAAIKDLIPIDANIPNHTMQGITSAVSVTRLEQVQNFKFESKMQEKKISLMLKDVFVKRLPDHSGAAGIPLDLTPYSEFIISKLYLIYEVLYASEFGLDMSIGVYAHSFNQSSPTPIGFKLCKFNVSTGIVLEDPCDMKSSFQVRWLPRFYLMEKKLKARRRSGSIQYKTCTCHQLPVVQEADKDTE